MCWDYADELMRDIFVGRHRLAFRGSDHMDRDDRMAEDSLLTLIAGTLGIDPAEVTEASDMSNTRKWDSLRQIMLMTELETHFGLRDQRPADAGDDLGGENPRAVGAFKACLTSARSVADQRHATERHRETPVVILPGGRTRTDRRGVIQHDLDRIPAV